MTSLDSDREKSEYGSNGLLHLADLAGIKGPGNTIRIVTELVSMGIPSREVHKLLRDVLASKCRTKRSSAKSTSSSTSDSCSSIALPS